MTRTSFVGFVLTLVALVICGCRSQPWGRFSTAAPQASGSCGAGCNSCGGSTVPSLSGAFRVCALGRSMNAHVKESALILLEADDEIESGDDKNRSRDPSDGGVGTLGGQADLA